MDGGSIPFIRQVETRYRIDDPNGNKRAFTAACAADKREAKDGEKKDEHQNGLNEVRFGEALGNLGD